MKKQLTYRWWLLAVLIVALSGCGDGKALNERLSFWRKDKIPYGTYYSFEALSHMFPEAQTAMERSSPVKLNQPYWPPDEQASHETGHEKKATIVIAPSVRMSRNELKAIIGAAESGDIVFLSAMDFSEGLLDSFKLKAAQSLILEDSLRLTVLDPDSLSEKAFAYPGKGMNNYFTAIDTGYCAVLGRNGRRQPNFVRIRYVNGGAIFFHLEPLAFTNFFLLHKNNKEYYDAVFSYLPPDIKKIVWNDYYRTHQQNDKSSLDVIMKYPPLRWAFWLVLLLFAIIYLFESKRKQRLIPVIRPPANTSLDFVKTIGRLYFQRRDNRNLAAKMVAHFLGHVRSRYKISTSAMDEEFEKRLAYKSGYDPVKLRTILESARGLGSSPSVSDQDLLAFHELVEKFYKQA